MVSLVVGDVDTKAVFPFIAYVSGVEAGRCIGFEASFTADTDVAPCVIGEERVAGKIDPLWSCCVPGAVVVEQHSWRKSFMDC
jgi:hypothetical protein